MKIDKKVLQDFLKKTTLTGTEGIDEVLLDFTEQGLIIKAMSPSNVTRVDSLLKPSAFSSYESCGKIALNDIKNFLKILSMFQKEITVTIEGSTLKIEEGSKSVNCSLMDTQFIAEMKDMKELEFADEVEISSDALAEFIKSVSVNMEFNVVLTTAEKRVRLSNNGKYKFSTEIDSPRTQGGTTVTFGTPFKEAIENLDNVLLLQVKNNYPVKIVEKTEHSVVSIITAPLNKE